MGRTDSATALPRSCFEHLRGHSSQPLRCESIGLVGCPRSFAGGPPNNKSTPEAVATWQGNRSPAFSSLCALMEGGVSESSRQMLSLLSLDCSVVIYYLLDKDCILRRPVENLNNLEVLPTRWPLGRSEERRWLKPLSSTGVSVDLCCEMRWISN